ncbi:A disintegrin and metalloproteinase with thrombospondin motifs 9-like [Tubulanus polymorphus]|uniref:A disintegrin and metalloproteinase with thrombospondin motifs 9-like n=1 Tax=Tubulanus polymorphus TaxID=672921 RepID=UPI003DA5926E
MKTTSLILTFLIAVVHKAWCCDELPKTCIDAGATASGYYTLYLGSKSVPVTIFCSRCRKEYITLKAINYGQVTCDHHNMAHCGKTTWQKIRIDPQTLHVIGNDYTYSTPTGPVKIPFGQGGGCVGVGKISGGFALDLTGTSFEFDTIATKWKAAGWRPISQASINADNRRKASGKCGGYCGICEPVGNITLTI